ncbi:reverse transcriptase domain-containing protein [Tanacetum coccineum]|uniref:Reverse transcriptase domain-containing protein n=1 Tax=Tanacetum coccineum TaxID=301880 RepID=A0ABQ5DF51_9ASTR
MHVFVKNFKYVMDFMIVKDISLIIDPRLSQVILGRPFVEISNMTHDPPEGVVRFVRVADKVAYKMPHKIEQYDSLSDLEKEHTKSVYLRYKEDKRRGVEYVMSKILGFYKEFLELGPEYLTGVDDEGEVTSLLTISARNSFAFEPNSNMLNELLRLIRSKAGNLSSKTKISFSQTVETASRLTSDAVTTTPVTGSHQPRQGERGDVIEQLMARSGMDMKMAKTCYHSHSDLGASINLMPYSLYAKLSLKTLKPTKMSVRLADRSFQYPVGIAENMLVEIGKFKFPANFVILEMEEDSKVPLILGRPFLHTADVNLGVGTERMIFSIDSAIKHSYSNDDTCFSIDVIDEILEEDFDALLDEGSEILYSIERTILEEKLFAKFDEFMAMTADENSESESDTEEPPFEKIIFNTNYKIKTSLEEPPMDLELKPLPTNLEYVFLEEPSFLPIIISSQLYEEDKNKLVSVFKKHKRAFAWETTDIPGIYPSFYSPWVSPIYCVPKKGGITVVTNERNELVPTRTVTEGIVLGHKVSEAVLEVDKAKIDVISKLPPPTNIKALRHLFKKQDAKPRLIRWILLLQEFDIEIKDRKGIENVTADHLSRIEKEETSDDSEVDDNFLGETLMEINTKDDPWFADFTNYLVHWRNLFSERNMSYAFLEKKQNEYKECFGWELNGVTSGSIQLVTGLLRRARQSRHSLTCRSIRELIKMGCSGAD